jgi:hypothetical protein
MKRRSLFGFVAVQVVIASSAVAWAQATSVPIGKWLGAMEGFGDVTLTVSGVKANGKVEGQMNFSGPNYTFVFGDAVNRDASPQVGTAEMVDGQLIINAPQGGVYKLTPGKNRIHGSFSRGPLTGTLDLDKAT